ncbi:MAG: twin-arginine translocase TatA/TatE family subunit [Chlamydiales bacterium]|nr:twin-arginine translocase TatA/TatE family subunit [Chlamydiia bacterium]MCP5507433.1 twin-arginine translocase TatA/TatE family subunit [Chlamydiales bacterium]
MIGTTELIVILCVALLLFGGKRLPELARNLGKGLQEFKKATLGADEDKKED